MLRHVKQGLSKRPSLTAWIHFLRGVYHMGSRTTAIFLAGQWGPLDLMQAWRATRPRSSVQLQLLPLWWNRKSGSKVMASWRFSRLRVSKTRIKSAVPYGAFLKPLECLKLFNICLEWKPLACRFQKSPWEVKSEVWIKSYDLLKIFKIMRRSGTNLWQICDRSFACAWGFVASMIAWSRRTGIYLVPSQGGQLCAVAIQ